MIPCNLYGYDDDFSERGHVISSIINKIKDAKAKKEYSISVWGDGSPRREFLHVDDAADAIVFAAHNISADYINIGSGEDISIHEVKFDSDGLTLGVGTSNGFCILYDIRSSKPLYTKEHQYELPVFDICFHNDSKHIISTDKKIVKIWERNGDNMGKIMTNIETPADINGVHVVSDKRGQSGLLMLAGEKSKVMTFFVPQLGPAPRWCSFLENLTEELEETSGTNTYEDFKFLTKAEIDELGVSEKIMRQSSMAIIQLFYYTFPLL
jgi:WD40 repeat protein